MLNVADIDQKIADSEAEFQQYEALLSEFRQSPVSEPDDKTIAEVVRAEVMLKRRPAVLDSLRAQRTQLERADLLQQLNTVDRKLRRQQKDGKKLWTNEAQARNAWIAAFAAQAAQDHEIAATTDEYNRLAVALGMECEPPADAVADSFEGVIAGLMSTALSLSSERDKRRLPSLGMVGKVKLAVDVLMTDGEVLTPDQLGKLSDHFDHMVAAMQSQFDSVQFDNMMSEAAEYIKAAKAVRPPVRSGPHGAAHEILLRAGIPQSAINAVNVQVQRFDRQLHNEPEPQDVATEPGVKAAMKCMSCGYGATAAHRGACPRCAQNRWIKL
jgi:hypothetical protein